MKKIFPELYSKTKTGAIQVCRIIVTDNEIITVFGQIDGQMQTAVKICEGKNIGRSNETTPHEQACSQAESMWKKKLRLKYEESIEALDQFKIRPMLAKKFSEKKTQWPCLVQPKLDGLRCMSYWKDGKIVLQSRGGKFYNVEHIAKQLEDIVPKGMIFDGELYIHGVSLQDINSLVKKPKPESKCIEYWVYDCVKNTASDDSDMDARYAIYKSVFTVFQNHCGDASIKKVLCYIVYDMDSLKERHSVFVSEGFEGTIVRNICGTYEFGYRSTDLMKYKDFSDAEFTVVGFEEGTGKLTGTPIWICKNDLNDETFNVTPTGTITSRKKMFLTAEEYIGKLLTVRFIDRTDKLIPKFAVGVAFRLDEDL